MTAPTLPLELMAAVILGGRWHECGRPLACASEMVSNSRLHIWRTSPGTRGLRLPPRKLHCLQATGEGTFMRSRAV